jgi:hypothetical protein
MPRDAASKKLILKGWYLQLSGDLFAASNLIGLWALLTLHDVKFDIVTFLQAFISIDLDGAVVDEDVRSVVPSDKTIALCVIEPLDLAFVLSHVPLTFLTADCGWGLPTCLQ